MQRLILSSLTTILLALPALVQAQIAIERPVEDRAGLLQPAERERVASRLVHLRQETGVQMAVLLVETTGGVPIEEFSLKVAEGWKGGQKGEDNGLLFVLAYKDRRMRLEVGRGLESHISDAIARHFINGIKPQLRKKDYAGAVNRLVYDIGQGLQPGIFESWSALERPLTQDERARAEALWQSDSIPLQIKPRTPSTYKSVSVASRLRAMLAEHDPRQPALLDRIETIRGPQRAHLLRWLGKFADQGWYVVILTLPLKREHADPPGQTLPEQRRELLRLLEEHKPEAMEHHALLLITDRNVNVPGSRHAHLYASIKEPYQHLSLGDSPVWLQEILELIQRLPVQLAPDSPADQRALLALLQQAQQPPEPPASQDQSPSYSSERREAQDLIFFLVVFGIPALLLIGVALYAIFRPTLSSTTISSQDLSTAQQNYTSSSSHSYSSSSSSQSTSWSSTSTSTSSYVSSSSSSSHFDDDDDDDDDSWSSSSSSIFDDDDWGSTSSSSDWSGGGGGFDGGGASSSW